MDFLDSLDLDVSHKRSRRVRSWYLYEQFKSLERNQLDAVRQLKDRSHQDRILRQELCERKARRKLYDQFGVCQSDSELRNRVKSEGKTSRYDSSDDFFESFQELRDDECLDNVIVHDIGDTCSQDDSAKFYEECYHTDNLYEDDFKSVNPHDLNSYGESVNSVVNVKSDNTITDDIENNTEIKKVNKFEDINLNLEEVKEKLECLEKLTHMREYDKILMDDSLYSIEETQIKDTIMKDKHISTSDNNICVMWTKLVSFAYQIMQLHHGNCYYDYGSQFLTAVLACDVLRRGINRMCYILQPYVSPIKYATDSEPPVENHKDVKRKNPPLKQSRLCHTYKPSYSNDISTKTRNKSITARKYRSENFWEHHASPYSLENRINEQKYNRASEPRRRVPMSEQKGTSYHTIWPVFSNEDNSKKNLTKVSNCACPKVVNPMLRLSRYLDGIMKDIEDTSLI